ncbi:MAG: S9 family peptidase [Parasphingorhabdus sp.]|nr:S9 family peptidase [Parasphingorhabdus sp.]
MTQPPIAARKPHSAIHHGITLEDPYFWLRDPGYPEVTEPEILDYLKAENSYFEAQMAEQKPLVDTLFAEMKARIKEDDSSVPQKDGDWLYWSTFSTGDQYRKHWRRAVAGGEDVLILDENALAAGKEYFRLGALEISPDGRLMAYAYDDNGSERFAIHVYDLADGKKLSDVIPGMLSSIVWSSDSAGFVYGLANAQWRTDNLRYHRLGDDPASDIEILREDDEGFRVDAGLSAQEDWIILTASDHVTSEQYVVPASDPLATPLLISARKTGREYSVDVRDSTLYILTNDTHVNFRIATAALDTLGDWQTLIAGSDDHYLTGLSLFSDFYVVEGRIAGLDQIELRDYADAGKITRIAFPEASYDAGLSDNPEYAVDRLRLSYTSMVTPGTVFDYHLCDASLETLKVQEVPSGYDASQYVTERLMIAARDGTQIPVSIVYKKGFAKDGRAPLHLYAYGAYGYAVPPGFSTTRLSLVDRGFAFAIAHIRGGDDLGYQWYLDGKLEARTNTFNDFVDVARGLIDLGYTSAGKVTASGGSAGGELMGAVVNQAPELFGAVVAHVPFVDVLNTMLDDSLPLTPGEWPEWGNPITDSAAFELIRSYSPYDNIAAKEYPSMLFTGGLNDPRVTYWEPAKMVAKLRALKTDDNLLLLKTNMGAGHGGKSGRWESLYETAEEYAFILWQMDAG